MDRERTAWHEAGHALVGYLEFGNPGPVTIVPTSDVLGSQTTVRAFGLAPNDLRELARTRPSFAEERARAMLRYKLAGQAAESVFLGRLRSVRWDDEVLDALEAYDWSRTGSGWLFPEWHRVRTWLGEQERDLARFARTLLRKRRLSAEQVARLLDRLCLRRPLYQSKKRASAEQGRRIARLKAKREFHQ